MKLSEYLEEKCISVTKLSRKIGVSRHILYSIVEGNHNVSLVNAKKIVNETENYVTYDDLINETRSNKKTTPRRKPKSTEKLS